MEQVTTRCKMVCDSFTKYNDTNAVEFTPVINDGSKENEQFFAYTPGGKLSLTSTNPDIEFKPGKEYYIDIVKIKT